MARAWLITRDYLYSSEAGEEYGEIGTVGPSNAPEMLISILKRGGGITFIMRDDDGIPYYSGRATWDSDTDPEDGAYGPLGDFGMPNAGCTSIEYPHHPEYDCG